MKNKKVLILLGFLLIIYFIIMCVLLNDNKPFKGYIVASEIGAFKCTNENCKNVEYSDLENEKFTVIKKSDNVLLKNMRFEYINSLNLLDENNNWVSLDSKFVGYSNKFIVTKPTIIENTITSDEENTYINFLEKNYQLTFNDFYTNTKYTFNNNKKDYKIIHLSNYDSENAIDDKIFNIIDLYIGNKKESLVLDVTDNNNIYAVPNYNVLDISLLNGDIVIIITKTYFDSSGNSSVIIYRINKNKLYKMN